MCLRVLPIVEVKVERREEVYGPLRENENTSRNVKRHKVCRGSKSTNQGPTKSNKSSRTDDKEPLDTEGSMI